MYVTLLAFTLVWLIHPSSVHVNVIVHAIHHDIHTLVGSHHSHTGFPLSSALAVNVTFHAIVIVWLCIAEVKTVGVIPLVFIHPFHIYPLATVASIVTLAPYLYVFALSVLSHPLITALTHVHFFNVNAYVSLSYQHTYVVLLAVTNVVFVADQAEGGIHTLVLFKVLCIIGAVHILAKVNHNVSGCK